MSDLNKAYQDSLSLGQSHRDIFDWPSPEDVLNKVSEEIEELKEALKSQNDTDIFDEASDITFTLVQCLRHLNIDLGEGLAYSNKKFQLRFEAMNALIEKEGKDLKKMPLDEAETYWQKAKVHTKADLKKLLESFKTS